MSAPALSVPEKTSLAYLGLFDDKITVKLCNLVERYIIRRDSPGKYPKTVSFLIAECFQNVVRHGILHEHGRSDGHREYFQVDIYDDRAVVISANTIRKKDAQTLSNQIDQVNALDKTALTDMYKQKLFRGSLSEKGGAGLGLIEMGRKSGLPLDKFFEPVNEDFERVFLSLEIPKTDHGRNRKTDISSAVKSYREYLEEKTILRYSGNLSGESCMYLIEMLHTHFMKRGNISPEKVKSIITIIEILQNVTKHGWKADDVCNGELTVYESGNGIRLVCGNAVDMIHRDILRKALERIKAGSPDDIAAWYKENLQKTPISAEGNSGLGLLEIARNTNNAFRYTISTLNGGLYYYSIETQLD